MTKKSHKKFFIALDEVPTFKCEICGKPCATANGLNIHKAKMHPDNEEERINTLFGEYQNE